MKHYHPDSRSDLHGCLTELRQALEAKRDELIRDCVCLEKIAIERVPDLTDPLVGAGVRDLAAEQMRRNVEVLHQVWDALDRIAQGRYGICLNCGEPVCAKGLSALPWAALCQGCQQVRDSPSADGHPTIFHAA